MKLIDLGTVIKYTPRPDDVYGTHGFYAPEAVKNPSPETDLYSICRTLAYMVTLMDLANPIFGMPSSEYYKAFRDYPALYRLLYKGTHPKPAQRFHSAEELSDQLNGVLRLVTGGALGMPVNSRLFLSSVMTTTGKLGLRGEAALDEKDKAIGLLRYGDQSLRSGNFANALTFYRQALQVNPTSVDAHLRLAEVQIEQGEFSQALAEVTKVQRMAPGNWKIAWYTGRLLEAEGKLTAATDQYRELMADLPGELPPQLALARVSARQGNDSMAVDLFSSVLKADPGNTDAILGVTNSFLNLKRWDDAAQVLSSVSEAAAKYVDAQLLLCDLYINRMTPLSMQNVERASHAVQTLSGRTEDARYFLIRGDIYRAAWQLARQQKLPPKADIAGISNISPRALGSAAEESYKQYLLRTQPSTDRETIVRRKLEVAPWRPW
ncbi:MAG: tetratricopeptide repeat protein [Ktedonobacteraceae bacterium]|nr:tetratricopeptide repeat protein [Ktedonobacteraceae bacterium]